MFHHIIKLKCLNYNRVVPKWLGTFVCYSVDLKVEGPNMLNNAMIALFRSVAFRSQAVP